MEIIKEEIKNYDKERLELMKEIVSINKKYLRCVTSYEVFLNNEKVTSYDIFEDTIDKQKRFINFICDCDVDDIDSSVHKKEFTLSNLRKTRDEFLDDLDGISIIIRNSCKKLED